MACAVEPIAWGDKNRVQLTAGKTHEWVLARTMRDGPTIDSVVATARAVMVKWFDGIALDTQFADAGNAVDDIAVITVSELQPLPSSSDQRRENLQPLPMLAPGPSPPLYVTIRFNYRGYATSLPWPVWTATVSPMKIDKLCPMNADWMLVSAKQASQLSDVPHELGPLDKLAAHAGGGLGELGGSLSLLTDAIKWGLYLYVGVQLVQVARSLPSVPVRRRAS